MDATRPGKSGFSWRRARPVLAGVAACGAALALAGGPQVSNALLLPAVFMLSEFTGGWIALAICSGLLGACTALFGIPSYPLMLTALAAFAAARAMRAGLPALAPVALLACAGAGDLVFAGNPHEPLPDSVASLLIAACVNVALVTFACAARSLRMLWLKRARRWRHEDVLFIACTAALVPAGLFLEAADAAHAALPAWSAVALIVLVQLAVAVVSLLSRRTAMELRTRLRDGRQRSARRRSGGLPRETAYLFLTARQVTDHLHRRTAVQGMQLESARLRAGRITQQFASIERERRGKDLELQRAQGALAGVDRRWRTIVDAVPEALFIVEPSGRIEFASEGVRQFLGHDPAKLQGMRIADLLPASRSDPDPLELGPTFLEREPLATPAERQVRFSDSKGALRTVSARVQLLRFPDGSRWCIRLREASGPLQRARDQFVATMSHEIRTPLHGLMATLDMLRSESLSEEGSRRLGIARTSARTLIRIANDVLDLSRISMGGMPIERKPMSIERLVTDVIDEARAREEAMRLDVHVELGRSVPPAVLGDPLRIKQVLRNLVSNALKFTPSGSVTVSAQWSGGVCSIDVADTGAGVPVDRRESIFEAFVQADGASSRRQGGAGLGLAIARQLSEAMGGSLTLVHSGPAGSTFRMVLPLTATDEMPLEEQSQRNLQAVKGRILVAEDDEASRYVAATLLESLGCPSRIVSNGTEALELMHSEEFDLALLDCEMPGLDGYEVTARIRRAGGRHIPIIAMTASTMAADRQRCFEAGMDDLLAKPFGKSALNEMLAKWLAPQPGQSAQAPIAKEITGRPELDDEVFDELRQSLNWQLPPLRKIYASVRESAQKATHALGNGTPADRELALRRLHSLLGGAGLVGARQIEYLAARLEQALKLERQPDLDEGMALLPGVLARFNRTVEGRLDQLSGR